MKNNKTDILYQALYTDLPTFSQCMDYLLEKASAVNQVVRLTFFAKVDSNTQYVELYDILKRKVRTYFKDQLPVVSLVAQAPLQAKLVLEIQAYEEIPDLQLRYDSFQNIDYVMATTTDYQMIHVGGFQSDVISKSIQEQCLDVFKQITAFFQEHRIDPQDIVRQWNYIETITRCVDKEQHYQLFNNARSSFYKTTSWDNGYPAATGIGMQYGGILVDLDHLVAKSDSIKIERIDNALQVAAYDYSEHVLVAEKEEKSTPKFERAKSFECGTSKLIYISGTAAIRGEDNPPSNDIAQQFAVTMENIEQLIADCKLYFLRIYLKDGAVYEEVKNLMEKYDSSIPYIVTVGDVCRDELVIEIEGVAQNA